MKCALLLIAHGSRQASANDDLHYLAEQIRRRGSFHHVEASFLELAEPSIEEGARRCVMAQAERVVMLPYFLSAGVHVQRDIQAACVQSNEHWPDVDFVLAEPLGRHSLLVDIVLERAAEVDRKTM